MSSSFENNKGSRRRFLESSAGMAAGMISLGSGQASAAANSNLQVAVVGVRSRGRQLIKRFAKLDGVHIQAICDIDLAQANRAAGELRDLQRTHCRVERDYRNVLAAGDIDAVVIATPDHWHAPMCIDALNAGKHVFVETPMSHTATETAAILDAARNSDRVVFCGMQQRSMPHMQSAIENVRSGRIGSVRLARAWTSHRRKSIGLAPDGPAPVDVDYRTWLGPAPSREFNPNRFHYSWRWFWDYGGGELTNWGIHMIDIARLGLGVGQPNRVTASGGKYHFNDDQETPDTLTVNYDFADSTLIWEHREWCTRQIEGRSAGVAFYGENGTLIVDRSGWKIYDSGETVPATETSRGDTVAEDFVAAIRTGDTRRDQLQSAAISTDLCHMGNSAYRQSAS